MYLYSLECLRFHDLLNFISPFFLLFFLLYFIFLSPLPPSCINNIPHTTTSPLPAFDSECWQVWVVPDPERNERKPSWPPHLTRAMAVLWMSPVPPALLPSSSDRFHSPLARPQQLHGWRPSLALLVFPLPPPSMVDPLPSLMDAPTIVGEGPSADIGDLTSLLLLGPAGALRAGGSSPHPLPTVTFGFLRWQVEHDS